MPNTDVNTLLESISHVSLLGPRQLVLMPCKTAPGLQSAQRTPKKLYAIFDPREWLHGEQGTDQSGKRSDDSACLARERWI